MDGKFSNKKNSTEGKNSCRNQDGCRFLHPKTSSYLPCPRIAWVMAVGMRRRLACWELFNNVIAFSSLLPPPLLRI